MKDKNTMVLPLIVLECVRKKGSFQRLISNQTSYRICIDVKCVGLKSDFEHQSVSFEFSHIGVLTMFSYLAFLI